ncbi:MAG: MATE family efflux transporter [Spirochaetes bacterium]|nr:MATE family efflux transporter [Spirochaetota bacterium]
MKNTIDLAEKKIGPLLLSYYLPAFIGVITGALYNIIARIFIGQSVGHEALSGLSVVFPIMVIIMAFGMLCGIGSGIMTSMALGRHDKAYAEKILGNAVVLMIIISLILTIVGFIIKIPLLHSFGATHETIEYANDYLDLILIGTLFATVGYGLNSSIRAEGNAKIAMYSMLISIVINVILDAILILWLNMGVKGAALATVIAQFALMLFVIFHFRSNRAVINLRLQNLKPEKKIVIGIVSSGMAPFVMQIANSIIQGVFNTQLIKYGGDISVAAMGIINSVVILFVMSIIALNMAAQPIFGYNYSAGNYKRVKETLDIAIKSATILAIIAFIVIEIFPHWIILMFNNNEELIIKGTTGMRIFIIMFPLVGFQIITGNFLQSIGRVNTATMMTLMRQVFLVIPFLFILPKIFFLNGVWLAMPVSDCINAVIVFYILKKYRAKITYQIENVQYTISWASHK